MKNVEPPSLNYLREVKLEKDTELERVKLAISLKICPKCGSPLIEEPKEVLEKPEKFLWGLITRRHRTWDYRNICFLDKKHYEEKYNFSSYDYGMI